MSDLVRKLKRAAVEPSRVFAQSDTRDLREPLWHFTVGSESWFAPWAGAWMVVGGDCKVLTRAVDKLGMHTFGEAPGISRLLARTDTPVNLDEPELNFAGAPKHIYPVCRVTGDRLCLGAVPATPVYYAYRRFGTDGTWVLSESGKAVIYCVNDVPVAVVALGSEPEPELAETA